MATQDFTENKDKPTPHYLTGYGVNDTQAITVTHEFFRLNGINVAFGIWQRLEAKRLGQSLFPHSITCVHSCQNGKVIIQTESDLRFLDEYELLGDVLLSDMDGSVMQNDNDPYDVV